MSFSADRVSIDGYVVRDVRHEDVDGLLVVERDAQPAPWTRAVMERELDVEYSTVWVVESETDICGFLVFWEVRDELHVLNVAVHSDHRRKGIARALLTSLGEQAVENHMTIISLEVRETNRAAQKLYDGLGYSRIAVRPKYYTDSGEDAWVLAKIIEEPDSD